MKLSSLLAFLLVLHLLLCGARGTRIGKFAKKSATSQFAKLENENEVKKEDQSKLDSSLNNKVQQRKIEVVCEDDHCSSKGKNRKLITSATMSTSTAKPIQENSENGGEKMDLKRHDIARTLSTSSSSIHHSITTAFDSDKRKEIIPPPRYEDAMDMTVMDYSPAKRKPPIHN